MEKGLGQDLARWAADLGVELTPEALDAFGRLASELLRWNERVNLTAVRERVDVYERHFLDSLALVPLVDALLEPGATLLDVGAGAGFPGLPVAIARPELRILLVDSVGKKTAFLEHAVSALGLARCEVRKARLEGKPEREGIAPCDAAVARALMPLDRWLALGRRYVRPGGIVLAMLARTSHEEIRAEATRQGVEVLATRAFVLPRSGAPRTVAAFRAGA